MLLITLKKWKLFTGPDRESTFNYYTETSLTGLRLACIIYRLITEVMKLVDPKKFCRRKIVFAGILGHLSHDLKESFIPTVWDELY